MSKLNSLCADFFAKRIALSANEDIVFNILSQKGEMHAPAISRASGGAISLASVYTILSRLEKKRVVNRREDFVVVDDIRARRVYYSLADE